MKIHVQRGQIMIKSIAVLALAASLGGCAVYSDVPYGTNYGTTYSSGVYSGSNVVVTPAPIILDTYPNYRYSSPYYNSPYYRPPVYRPPVYNHPNFNRPGFNRPNPGVRPQNAGPRPGTPPRNPGTPRPPRDNDRH